MTDSAIFEFVAGELERATSLGRPAARAAVRGVLESARYDPESVSAGQMQALIERLLPSQIRASGVEDADRVCQQLAAALAMKGLSGEAPESPDEIFGRMIRR